MVSATLKLEIWLATAYFVIDGSDAVRDAKQSDDTSVQVQVSDIGGLQPEQSEDLSNHSNRTSRDQARANLSVYGAANQSERMSTEGRARTNFSLHDSLNASSGHKGRRFHDNSRLDHWIIYFKRTPFDLSLQHSLVLMLAIASVTLFICLGISPLCPHQG